jgi:hypothetical protein
VNIYKLCRGTPCDVRRAGETNWRAHVCSTETELTDRLANPHSEHWLFHTGGWEIRVRVPFLSVLARTADELHYGVTGTREGLTSAQRSAVREYMAGFLKIVLPYHSLVFHHGGCVGADRHVHNVVREVWGKVARIVVHPASDQPETLCDWTDADELREPAPSLVRNRNIVDAIAGGSLYACPKLMREELRSGTWATIRASTKLRKGSVLFWPDGTVGGIS